jgi:hypothetical protein
MSFFNEPLIIITPLGDNSLESNVPVEIPFYFTDINNVYGIADVAIEYYTYTKNGRDTTNLSALTPVTIDALTSSLSVTVTVPTTVDVIYFMFKVIIGTTVYWISTEPFYIIKPGV